MPRFAVMWAILTNLTLYSRRLVIPSPNPCRLLPCDTELALGAGRRELGLPAPSAKTQKYAMIAMERANEAPKLLQLIQSIESPDSAMYGIGVRSALLIMVGHSLTRAVQSMHWTRNARRSQRLGCAGPGVTSPAAHPSVNFVPTRQTGGRYLHTLHKL